MTRTLCGLLLALLMAAAALGQNTGVLIVDGSRHLDAEQDIGLVRESEAGYGDNLTKLQTWIDATPYRKYPLFFPGAAGDLKNWIFTNSIILPQRAGIKWTGCGYQDPAGYHAPDTGTRICLRAITSGTTFDGGATYYLESTGAGTTVVVHGRTVAATDVHQSVHITGGTNVTKGWYGIASVNTGAGTWTLDRNWCIDATTNGAGYFCPEIVNNSGFGTTVEGMTFTGKVLGADAAKAIVLWHNMPQWTGGNGVLSGAHANFHNCGFSHSQVGILDGFDLAHAYEDGESIDWTGRTYGHADSGWSAHLTFSNVNTCRYRRNQNGVWGYDTCWRVQELDGDMLYFDCGGKELFDTAWISGTTGRQCVLHLGAGIDTNQNPDTIRNISFDHSTAHPQLVITDFTRTGGQNDATVFFDGGQIDVMDNDPTVLDDYYIVDIKGKVRLTIRDWIGANTSESVGGFWAGSFRLRADSAGNVPFVLIENTMLDVSDASTIVDAANSASGATVKFVNCYDKTYTPIADETYVVPAP